jgi:hypothetical protein
VTDRDRRTGRVSPYRSQNLHSVPKPVLRNSARWRWPTAVHVRTHCWSRQTSPPTSSDCIGTVTGAVDAARAVGSTSITRDSSTVVLWASMARSSAAGPSNFRPTARVSRSQSLVSFGLFQRDDAAGSFGWSRAHAERPLPPTPGRRGGWQRCATVLSQGLVDRMEGPQPPPGRERRPLRGERARRGDLVQPA